MNYKKNSRTSSSQTCSRIGLNRSQEAQYPASIKLQNTSKKVMSATVLKWAIPNSSEATAQRRISEQPVWKAAPIQMQRPSDFSIDL